MKYNEKEVAKVPEENQESIVKEAKEGKSWPAWFNGYRHSSVYQITHFKYVQLIVCQLYINKNV